MTQSTSTVEQSTATAAQLTDALLRLLEHNYMVLIWPAPEATIRVQINKLCCHKMVSEATAEDFMAALEIATARIQL